MCFDQPTSFGFALTGLVVAGYAHQKLSVMGGTAARGATRFCAGVLYFVLMETLQGVSYWYIDQCESKTNQLLTVLGFLHICGQPFFTHLMCGAFYRPGGTRAIQNDFALRITAMGGFAFAMRYVLAAPWSPFVPDSYRPLDGVACPNTEWIAASTVTPGGANTTCTFSGVHHLAWSVPMYQPTYFTPSCFIHCFVMFAPFFATPGIEAKLFGLFLFLTGPLMSTMVTDDLNEQASIWCFFSICQITLMFCGVLGLQIKDSSAGESPRSGGGKRIKAN